jgi:putative ABC transport system ATP-binding protein/macrolide transport system ATP-binding/permease protein
VRPPDAERPEAAPAAHALAVTRRFDSVSGSVLAVHEVDVEVPRHLLTVIAGPSGSGKSTLLGLLACLDRPDGGQVWLDRVDTTPLSRRRRRHLRRDQIGIVLPQPSDNLLDRLDAGGNLAWAARQRGSTAALTADQRAEILSGVGLAEMAAKGVRQLSGGEQQRLALACAIVGDPLLVVADEPTASLDRASADRVVNVLRAAADRGVTLVVAGHDRRVIEAADRVVELDHGRRIS